MDSVYEAPDRLRRFQYFRGEWISGEPGQLDYQLLDQLLNRLGLQIADMELEDLRDFVKIGFLDGDGVVTAQVIMGAQSPSRAGAVDSFTQYLSGRETTWLPDVGW